MIKELKESEFYVCKELLNENGQLEAKAIVEGINPGRIFVDDMESPASGLIWLGNNDGFIFIGNERNDEFNAGLNHLIDTVIAPDANKVGLIWFEGVGNHPQWNATIEKVFANRRLGSWNQRVYTLQKDDYKAGGKSALEEGYKIVQISEIFNDKQITNIDFLHAKIGAYWASSESFFQRGAGYCVVQQNKIVSVCFSGFVVEPFHCVDIETLEEHRGKKLAQLAADAFVEDCLNHNFVPYWDCMESNKPSIAVAENIGFKNVFNYIGYEFKFEV
ncbi:GNAT family N-acetyltransferase [Cytobacillus gottheilii]|uniref:GNAT family N-acetyltransferase n=1 Tax=Cytobacillus gottheilii TaxID=859144 RepID=UPI003CF90B79